MTKLQEQQLIKQVADLQKQVSDLYTRLENNKLEKHVYTVAETAKILEVTPQAVYAMIARGEMENIKVGHKKIPGSEIKRILGSK